MSKQKVLIAIHQLNLGGAQKALVSALNAIDYTKNDVTLYIRKDRLDLLDSVNKNVSRIIINKDQTKYYRKPYVFLLELLIWIKKLFHQDVEKTLKKQVEYIIKRQQQYEHLHYFSDNKKYDIAISYIQGDTALFVHQYIRADKKSMFFHGSTDDHHELHERIMNDYDNIICVSRGALNEVQKFYPKFASNMSCIENYVDAEEVRTKANEYNPNYPKGKLILCTCGRIASVKGFDLAVEAARLLKKNGICFRWYFIGDGPDRSKIEQLIVKYQLEDYIIITGLQHNPYPYIKNCDIYIQPSYEESQGLTIIEAQILARSTVSTATIGGKGIIRDAVNGLLSEIEPMSIAEKIIRLSTDNEMRNRIETELQKIDYTEEYTRFCRQWAELLGDN